MSLQFSLHTLSSKISYDELATSVANLEKMDQAAQARIGVSKYCLKKISEGVKILSILENRLRTTVSNNNVGKTEIHEKGPILPKFSHEQHLTPIESLRTRVHLVLNSIHGILDKEFTFHVQRSPLSDLYYCLQKLKNCPNDKVNYEFVCIYRSLSKDDQDLFHKAFITFGMIADEECSLIVEKHPKLFQALKGIPNSEERNKLEKELFTTLRKEVSFNEGELSKFACFKLPKQAAVFELVLLNKFEILTTEQQTVLYNQLREIAITQDLVNILDWDKEWGKYNLQSDHQNSPWASRLVRGLNAIDIRHRDGKFQELIIAYNKKLGEELTRRLFKYCPLVDIVRKGELLVFANEMAIDLNSRAEQLQQLHAFKEALSKKHSSLESALQDPSHLLHKLWKEKELRILLCPKVHSAKELAKQQSQITELFVCLDCLQKEEIDSKSAEVLLEMILKRFSFHPRQDQIYGQVSLYEIKKRGMEQALNKAVKVSEHSRCKNVYSVRAEDSITIGKFKPNPSDVVAKEVRGYVCDSIFGFGMTPPTGFARLTVDSLVSSLKRSFQLVSDKFKYVELVNQSGEKDLAKLASKEATELYNQALDHLKKFPVEIQKEIHRLFEIRNAKNLQNKTLSNDLINTWHLAIDDFLQSEALYFYKENNAFESNPELGSIQSWINEPSQRVIDFIVNNPNAGDMLKQLPKVYVHLYCLLGLIKGSEDGFSGNALVTFASDGGIKQIQEFDDERSLPKENIWSNFRIWQLGLPQADLPFDRPTLMLFSRTDVLKTIFSYNNSKNPLIDKQSIQAQEHRILKLISTFTEELQKPVPTLTPRGLFFLLSNGETNFDYWHKEKNLNPWVVFEYCTGDVGRASYFIDQGSHDVLNANFEKLYDVEGKSKILFDAIKNEYPRVRLVVKYDAGFGNNLFIRGALAGISWENGCQLRCIDPKTWIFESDHEVIEGEYKIYLNNETEEDYKLNRVILANSSKSKVVYPTFPNIG